MDLILNPGQWLSRNQEMLKLINSFAPWFAAIGTIGAASMALYLGLRRDRIKLRVSAIHKLFQWEGGPRRDYLEIRVVEMFRFSKAMITGIDLKWGLLRNTLSCANV